MMMKIIFFSLIVLGMLSCSPVKFNAKSTDPNPCADESCVIPPDDGTSIWKVGTWGICSQSCNGTQSRSVACVNENNQPVPEDRCKEKKPDSTQSCNSSSNCNSTVPAWNWGSWGTCSALCDGGKQTRTVECRDTSGVKPDSACLEAKPPTEQACNTQACTCSPIDKTYNQVVPASNNKVDILVVVDDSSSMGPDNLKLADRLGGFVTDLQNNNLDWQMCITTTDVNYYEGRPIEWSGTTSRVINKTTPSLLTVFKQTIYDIGSGFGNDEQGIKASILSILNNPVYPCYRTGAALATVIITDEDERSVGGNSSLSTEQYKPLGVQNYPATFINTANAVFGAGKRMAVNSIVVRDNTCKQAQDPQGSPSFIGVKYMELSNLTNGGIGSICDTDYSSNLKYFKDAILSSVTSVDLECTPAGTPTVNIPVGYNWTLVGKKVNFTPALPAGTSININYKCCP